MKKLLLFGIITALLLGTLPAAAQDAQGVSKVGSIYNHWKSALKVEVQGNYAYVTTGKTGLSVMDISNPAQPSEAGYYITPGKRS